MIQEHERGAGGGQAEWPIVGAAVQATGAAVSSLAGAIEGLSVDPERMRANLEATGGTIFAERAVMQLAPLARPRHGAAAGRRGRRGEPPEWQRHSPALLRASVGRHGPRRSARRHRSPGALSRRRRDAADAAVERLRKSRTTMPFVVTDGVRHYYRLTGAAGRPVVMLSHSLGLDHGMWDPQAVGSRAALPGAALRPARTRRERCAGRRVQHRAARPRRAGARRCARRADLRVLRAVDRRDDRTVDRGARGASG